MSIKKIALISGIVAASFAATGANANDSMSAYAGLNLGWNATNSEETTTLSFDNGGATSVAVDTNENSLYGAAYGGVAGLKFPISTGYIGIEVNISDSSAETELDSKIDGTSIAKTSLTSDLSYGITGILGTEIAPNTFVYGLAGYQMTNFEGQFTERNVSTNAIVSSTADEDFGGARIGVGVESAVTDALSLRLEWAQTYYSEESLSFASANGGSDYATDIKPTETRVTLGIIGHF